MVKEQWRQGQKVVLTIFVLIIYCSGLWDDCIWLLRCWLKLLVCDNREKVYNYPFLRRLKFQVIKNRWLKLRREMLSDTILLLKFRVIRNRWLKLRGEMLSDMVLLSKFQRNTRPYGLFPVLFSNCNIRHEDILWKYVTYVFGTFTYLIVGMQK